MRIFTILCLSVLFVWVWVTGGIVEALFISLGCGIILFVIYTVADLVLWIEDRIWQKRHMTITHRYEKPEEPYNFDVDVIDAEVVEDRDSGKWWRV